MFPVALMDPAPTLIWGNREGKTGSSHCLAARAEEKAPLWFSGDGQAAWAADPTTDPGEALWGEE